MTAPHFYDVPRALRELSRYRDGATDPVNGAIIELAEQLAKGMAGHFADAAIAGHALVIAAGATSGPAIPPVAVSTIVALAGQRLAEGRAT